jgi:Smg protein
MFEVLVYVYENYWQGDACPEPRQLGRKLTAAGFEPDEIEAALAWLSGLHIAAHNTRAVDASDVSDDEIDLPPERLVLLQPQSTGSLRVYSVAEQDHLGAEALGFVCFLESAGVLPPSMREIVMDRAMAAPGFPLDLDDLKIIVLMVYWSIGEEPDALVLDELCDDAEFRLPH